MNAVIPSRTKYQLEHFVIGQHDTPQMQWRQVLIETQDLLYKIRSAELLVKKNKIKLNDLLLSDDPTDLVDAEQLELDIAMTELTLRGAYLEYGWLSEMAQSIGSFSTDEIENDQQNYWGKRLARQAELDVFSRNTGIGSGNAQSMLNAGLLNHEEGKCAISPGN